MLKAELANPQVRTMTTDELEEYLCSTLKTE